MDANLTVASRGICNESIGAKFTRNQWFFHWFSVWPARPERFLYGSNCMGPHARAWGSLPWGYLFSPREPYALRRVPVTTIQKSFGWSDQVCKNDIKFSSITFQFCISMLSWCNSSQLNCIKKRPLTINSNNFLKDAACFENLSGRPNVKCIRKRLEGRKEIELIFLHLFV